MNLGYIGIGIMGGSMAGNLLKAGHSLFIHNRTLSKCDSLAEAGAVVCQDSAEVASRAEVVFINVPDTADVEKVIFGSKGIVDSARTGLTVIDNSTISPQATVIIAQRLQLMGIDYLDAPVSGGDVGARNGTLTIMIGGEKDVLERYFPLLKILGSKIVHIGSAGAGQTCKACNQLFCALHMLACCEGIALAQKAGIDPEIMVETVSSGAGGSWALSNLGEKIIRNDNEPGFMIDLLVKDLQLVMELAHEAELPLTGTSLAQQLFHEAQERGLGREGTQALSQIIGNLL